MNALSKEVTPLASVYRLLGDDLAWIADYLVDNDVPLNGILEIAGTIAHLKLKNIEGMDQE
jgi:hypothetical protein